MSCDIRSLLRLLILASISCFAFSASAHAAAITFQEQETEELIEEVEKQLELQVDEKAEEPAAEGESSETSDAEQKSADNTEEEKATDEGVEAGGEDSKPEQEESTEEDSKEQEKSADLDSESESASSLADDADPSEEIVEETEDDSAAMVIPPSGEKEMLTPTNVRWIWNLLFVFLTICFLGWLLSLMTGKPEEKTVPASSDSDQQPNAKDLDFGKVYAARPSTVDDLTKIGGIDAAAEKRLNDAGIWQFDQLRKMTAQQRANLQRKLNLPRIRWYSLSGLGGDGVSNSAESNTAGSTAAGVATAAGAAGVAAASLVAASKDKGGSSSVSETKVGDDGTSLRIDSELGNVYVRPPKFRDDLSRLEGIDSKTAAAMNEAGIYSFKQIESMSPIQRLAFEKRFGVSVSRLNLGAAESSSVKTGQGGSSAGQGGSKVKDGTSSSAGRSSTAGVNSGSAAAGAGGVGTAGHVSPPKRSDSDKSQGGGVSDNGSKSTSASSTSKVSTDKQGSPTTVSGGTPSGSKPVHEKPSAGKPSSGKAPQKANTVSGFAASNSTSGSPVNGAKSSAPKDGANGIGKTAATVAGAAAAGAAGIAGAVSGAGRSAADAAKPAAAIASAKAAISIDDLVAAGKGRMNDAFGFLYTSAPVDADDLTKLVGIDAEAAKRLNEAGIYKFDQLSSLDESQTAALARRFRLPDADFSDWRRCFYAWGRGIATTAEADEVYGNGLLHGIELPQIANGVFDGEKLVAYPEQVIFRGSNPEGWGRGNCEGIEGVESAMSCDSIRSNINYLRIRRADTRESVVVPMTKGNIFSNGGDNENGWNGSSEMFFGGRHIGAFAQHLPQEVETKFSQGGWGFGHRYDHNDRQEWGWGGRVIEPTTFEVSVGCIGEVPGTVVFRSSDPTIWNTRTREGEIRYSDPVSSVSHPVNFVRIMREATGEAVIVRVDGKHILDEGFDPRCGWNGSGSEFSGGMHLGIYHSDLPQDFETRFEFGGWGFGHPYDDNDRQAWGWAGRQLPETVFEISLLESVPDFMQHELVE